MTNPSGPSMTPGPRSSQDQPGPQVNPVPPLSKELIRGQLEKRRIGLIQQLEVVEHAIEHMGNDETAEGVIAVLKAGTKL